MTDRLRLLHTSYPSPPVVPSKAESRSSSCPSIFRRVEIHSLCVTPEGKLCKLLTSFAAHRLYRLLPSLSVRSNNRDSKSTPVSRAKRDFNRAAMRERSKWERETVSNTPERGFSSSTAPSWGGSNARAGGTYAVATLIVAWAGLRSTPPEAERRRGAWFWQDGGTRDDDRDVGFSVVNRCGTTRCCCL